MPRELGGHSLLCVGEVIVSTRQISVPYKTTGSRPCKIREDNRVSPGVGLIDESKRKRVRGPHKGIPTSGPKYRGSSCKATAVAPRLRQRGGWLPCQTSISAKPYRQCTRGFTGAGLLSHSPAKHACRGLPLPQNSGAFWARLLSNTLRAGGCTKQAP